ncbi:hypothetical protein GGD67_002877 [Bradyrhizobium sp. IAR9]|uniref:hypothetical protein n=1 Tax=Bradyrhizobium sp. IAR9 TaxID=2663841 RepID=UPI0015CCBF0F|nr:hypothetical protein [Bradyrhizobium sp. IAR9]NYG45419.1 hypothetical protein [Bradyrhizobium sp. IAR9]
MFAGIGYGLIGFFVSYVLSVKIGIGVAGISIGLSIGTTVYATLLMHFHLLADRLAFRSRWHS